MDNIKTFTGIFNKLKRKYKKISMSGTVVCYDGKPVFNIEGHDLEYSICRLGKLLDEKGELNY